MKHIPVESFLSATGRLYSFASSRTSGLVKWPIGNNTSFNCSGDTWLKKYVWSLLLSTPLKSLFPLIRAYWPVAILSAPRFLASYLNKSNFIYLLHIISGFGVLPFSSSSKKYLNTSSQYSLIKSTL